MENKVKKILRISVFVLLPFITTACFVTYPKNALEFRSVTPKSYGGEKISFTVKRPYKNVAATFKKYAKKCFSVNMSENIRTQYQTLTRVYRYTPTLKIGKKKLELHVQKKLKGEKTNKRIPSKGIYYVVADAYKIDSNKTRVEIYGYSHGFTGFQKGIKNWAKGSPLGCPDLTK